MEDGLDAGHRRLARPDVPELQTLGRTLDRWLPEIITYFETGTHQRPPTGGCKRKVKQVKRVACGSGTTTTTS